MVINHKNKSKEKVLNNTNKLSITLTTCPWVTTIIEKNNKKLRRQQWSNIKTLSTTRTMSTSNTMIKFKTAIKRNSRAWDNTRILSIIPIMSTYMAISLKKMWLDNLELRGLSRQLMALIMSKLAKKRTNISNLLFKTMINMVIRRLSVNWWVITKYKMFSKIN